MNTSTHSEFNPKIKETIIARVYAKKTVQDMLKGLRSAGATVEKLAAGYQVFFTSAKGNKNLVFKAMNGNNGYLVRHYENLFI